MSCVSLELILLKTAPVKPQQPGIIVRISCLDTDNITYTKPPCFKKFRHKIMICPGITLSYIKAWRLGCIVKLRPQSYFHLLQVTMADAVRDGAVESREKARRRGRAYQCLHCFHKQRKHVIYVKGRVEDHILREHLSFQQDPFYRSLCYFRY